jgi:cytochrome c oxidase accessory protein FixG
VAVCPTGVDIRNGLQLDCIQCGLCTDACDSVMTKIGRPTGLIAYDTDMNVQARIEGRPEVRRVVRPRTILYAGLIVVVGAVMLGALAMRTSIDMSVMHDRSPVFVRLSDGSIRNAYSVRVANKHLEERSYTLNVEGLPGARLDVVGGRIDQQGRPVVAVGPDQTLEMRVLMTAGGEHPRETTDVHFIITDLTSGETAHANDHFKTPR